MIVPPGVYLTGKVSLKSHVYLVLEPQGVIQGSAAVSDYGDDWAGRYYSDQYTLVYVGLNPSLAYRLNDKWSLGLGANINYTYSSAKL